MTESVITVCKVKAAQEFLFVHNYILKCNYIMATFSVKFTCTMQ